MQHVDTLLECQYEIDTRANPQLGLNHQAACEASRRVLLNILEEDVERQHRLGQHLRHHLVQRHVYRSSGGCLPVQFAGTHRRQSRTGLQLSIRRYNVSDRWQWKSDLHSCGSTGVVKSRQRDSNVVWDAWSGKQRAKYVQHRFHRYTGLDQDDLYSSCSRHCRSTSHREHIGVVGGFWNTFGTRKSATAAFERILYSFRRRCLPRQFRKNTGLLCNSVRPHSSAIVASI